MRLGFGLQIQQTQRLIMTPELRQAIAVLQKPVAELGELIEGELLSNPCLETEPSEGAAEEPISPAEARKLLEYLGSDDGGNGVVQNGEDEVGFEAFTPAVPTLQDHLLAQLDLVGLRASQHRIAEFLIGSLDDHGYLTIDVKEVGEVLSVRAEQVNAALKVVQSFEPVGVGARSLQECLMLQWETVDDGNPLVPVLIEHHLDDLAAGRIPRIAAAVGATCAEVQIASDAIRTLDPKPGRRFGSPDETRYIVPDVMIERVSREYVVVVNDAPIPRLLVSDQYRRMLTEQVEHDARKFVEDKIQSALWLIKAIEQRRLTLYRVTEAIVQFQRDFLDHGLRYLRPLTLREVAEVVGVHESTVSRATSGKYAQTPQGTFELKFFFSSGVEGDQGEGVAAESVKRLIEDLITHEDANEPLSDQVITDRLGQQGLKISRRTVAKYREEMGLPSSAKRKRYM